MKDCGMNAKHTPAPWSIEGFDHVFAGERNYDLMVLGADRETIVAQCVADHNADIIRAAPELLDGCNAMLGLVQLLLDRDDLSPELRRVLTTNHRIDEAKAAVTKAGERSQ
jgi:hypothetical protein